MHMSYVCENKPLCLFLDIHSYLNSVATTTKATEWLVFINFVVYPLIFFLNKHIEKQIMSPTYFVN